MTETAPGSYELSGASVSVTESSPGVYEVTGASFDEIAPGSYQLNE